MICQNIVQGNEKGSYEGQKLERPYQSTAEVVDYAIKTTAKPTANKTKESAKKDLRMQHLEEEQPNPH